MMSIRYLNPTQSLAAPTHMFQRRAQSTPDYAPLGQFRSSTPHVLCGEALNEVKALCQSIKAEGLLFPLLVSEHKGRLIVIDGRKRLAALRRLRFMGELPRSLHVVPYVRPAHSSKLPKPTQALLPPRALYDRVMVKYQQGVAPNDIASALHISTAVVQDIISLRMLSPRLREAYWRGDMSLGQVKAFTTLNGHAAQDRLLSILGPFATVDAILRAVAKGQCVINMRNDNQDDSVIIMPSAAHRSAKALKAA